MVDLAYYLKNWLFLSHYYFWCPIAILLYYLRSSIIFCFSSGDIYLSLGISLSCSFVTFSELFCGKPLETFVILLAILLVIKSLVASAVFWKTLFEEVLSASVANYLAWLRSFWLYLPLKFLHIFSPIFFIYILAKDKNP